jgi:glycosyltransferase involved in cell wall biosynthesis
MLLFASLYEGFGLPALEAMAVGTPVLASTAPALVEVTGHAALHADARSHEDLVRHIRALDRDEPLRDRLILAGRERVQQFQWTDCAKATLAVYRQALGRS